MMSSVFPTVDGKLFTGENEVSIPEWIDRAGLKPPARTPKLAVTSDARVVNARHATAALQSNTAFTRELTGVALSERTLRSAALAHFTGFARQRHFALRREAFVDDRGRVVLEVDFEGNPGHYRFFYDGANGRVEPLRVFTASFNGKPATEYPFNEAGLNEALDDALGEYALKEPSLVKCTSSTGSRMTRAEIVRRCNNSLSLAKDRIEANRRAGYIVAVNGNEYASIYDLNYLFPDLREAPEVDEAQAFARVENRVPERVAKATAERKTPERLSLEAVLVLNEVFDSAYVEGCRRVSASELEVDAVVTLYGVRTPLRFNMVLDDECVGEVRYAEFEGERLGVNQVLSRLGGDRRVAEYTGRDGKSSGYVYSLANVHRVLGDFVSPDSLAGLVDDWCVRGLATRVDGRSVASRYSLNELIKHSNAEVLSDEEVRRVRADKAFFGAEYRVYADYRQDGDTRFLVAVPVEATVKGRFVRELPAAITCLSFDAVDVTDDYIVFKARCFSKDTGTTRVLDVLVDVLTGSVNFTVGGVSVDLETAFEAVPSVALAVAERGAVSSGGVFTVSRLKDELAGVVDPAEVDAALETWRRLGLITPVSSGSFASAYSLADLLESANVVPYDEETRRDILDAKSRLTDFAALVPLADCDTRTLEAVRDQLTEADVVYSALLFRFTDFTLGCLGRGKYTLVFNGDDGVTRESLVSVDDDGTVYCETNGERYTVDEFADLFLRSPLLKAYTAKYGRPSTASCLVTEEALTGVLGEFLSADSVKRAMASLKVDGTLTLTGNGRYRVNGSFEDLLRSVTAEVDDGEHRERVAMASRVDGLDLRGKRVTTVADCDTRTLEAANRLARRAEAVEECVARYLKDFGLSQVTPLTFTVVLDLGNGTVKTLPLVVEFDADDSVADVTVVVNGEDRGLDDLGSLFASTPLLEALTVLPETRETMGAVYTEGHLRRATASVLDDGQFADFVAGLLANGLLTPVGGGRYASKYDLAGLARRSSVLPSASRRRLLLALGDRLDDYRVDADYAADGDARRPLRRLTASAVKAAFAEFLPGHVACTDFGGVTVAEDRAEFTAACFNRRTGTSAVFDVRFSPDEKDAFTLTQGGRETSLEDGFNRSAAAAQAARFTRGDRLATRAKGTLSLAALRRRLSKVVDVGGLDEAVREWEAKGMVTVVGADKLLTDRTVDELLSASTLRPLDEATVARNLDRAAGVRSIVPRLCPVRDDGARVPVDGKTVDVLEGVKASLLERVNRARASKRLTAKTAGRLTEALRAASTQAEVAAVEAKLRPYLKGA